MTPMDGCKRCEAVERTYRKSTHVWSTIALVGLALSIAACFGLIPRELTLFTCGLTIGCWTHHYIWRYGVVEPGKVPKTLHDFAVWLWADGGPS
jgi:hypothetical protein